MGFLRKFVQAAANEIDKVAAELHSGGQRNQQGQYGPQGGYVHPQQQYQGGHYGHHSGYQAHSTPPNTNQSHGSYNESDQASPQPQQQPVYPPPPFYGQYAQVSPQYQYGVQPAQNQHFQQTTPAQSSSREQYMQEPTEEQHSTPLVEQQHSGQHTEQHVETHVEHVVEQGSGRHSVQQESPPTGHSAHMEHPRHVEPQEHHISHSPAQEQPPYSTATQSPPSAEHYVPITTKEPLVQVAEALLQHLLAHPMRL